MESNCLLELPMEEGGGILGEVKIQNTESNENDVSSILLDNTGENHGGSSYNASGIDFEFVNSELGSASTYTMDHSSVFDISEPVIDEKSELFRDTGMFDDCIVKHNESEKPNNLNLELQNGRKMIMDLGLKLQIIPLNNLKFVSTIQTSEGVHIVALPDNSSISQRSVHDQPLIRDIFSQLTGNGVITEDNVKLGNSKGVVNTTMSKKSDVLKIMELQNSGALSTINLAPSPTDLNLTKRTAKVNTIGSLHQLTGDSTHVRSLLDKQIMQKSNTSSRNLKINGHSHLHHEYTQKLKRQRKHMKTFEENDTHKGRHMERSVMKESKIIIDLRKLMPHRKPRRMVSLLSSPKTNKLFSYKCLNSNSKTKTVQQQDEKLQTHKKLPSSIPLKLKPDINKHDKNRKHEQGKYGVIESDEFKNSTEEKIVQKVKKSNKTLKKMDQGYKCTICQAKFVRLGNYKNHITLHKEIISDISIDSTAVLDIDQPTQTLKTNLTDSKGNFATESSVDGSFDRIEIIRQLEDDDTHDISSAENDSVTKTNFLMDEKVVLTSQPVEDKEMDTSVKNESDPDNGETAVNTTHVTEVDRHDVHGNSNNQCLQTNKNFALDKDTEIVEHCDVGSVNVRKKELQCYICQLTFSSEGNLTRHKLTHMKSAGRYTCDICKKSFMQHCDLKRHEPTHTGGFPYTCSTCSKGFLRKTDLSGHEKFHNKEKTQRCDLCSKSYYQSGDLQRHIRQSHQESCQFSCPYCSKKYTAQRSLFTHVRSKHLQQNMP